MPIGVMQIDVARHFRPCSNQRHVTCEYIPQLRQLIEFRFTQKLTNSSHPRVAISCYLQAYVLNLHGAQFEKRKDTSVSAHALLAKQHGPTRSGRDNQSE